jgi:hypothetical protein
MEANEEQLPLDPVEYTEDPEELADRAGVRRDGGTAVTEARRKAASALGNETAGRPRREPQPPIGQ